MTTSNQNPTLILFLTTLSCLVSMISFSQDTIQTNKNSYLYQGESFDFRELKVILAAEPILQNDLTQLKPKQNAAFIWGALSIVSASQLLRVTFVGGRDPYIPSEIQTGLFALFTGLSTIAFIKKTKTTKTLKKQLISDFNSRKSHQEVGLNLTPTSIEITLLF